MSEKYTPRHRPEKWQSREKKTSRRSRLKREAGSIALKSLTKGVAAATSIPIALAFGGGMVNKALDWKDSLTTEHQEIEVVDTNGRHVEIPENMVVTIKNGSDVVDPLQEADAAHGNVEAINGEAMANGFHASKYDALFADEITRLDQNPESVLIPAIKVLQDGESNLIYAYHTGPSKNPSGGVSASWDVIGLKSTQNEQIDKQLEQKAIDYMQQFVESHHLKSGIHVNKTGDFTTVTIAEDENMPAQNTSIDYE